LFLRKQLDENCCRTSLSNSIFMEKLFSRNSRSWRT
jgi:hypothetical protein